MENYKLVSKLEALVVMRKCRKREILSLLCDLSTGRPLHTKKIPKDQAIEHIWDSGSIVLDRDDDFSVLSIYSEWQNDICHIKRIGTKEDLIIPEG